MPPLSAAYQSTRRRIAELVTGLDGAMLDGRVPACPDWSVRDLVAHVSGADAHLSMAAMLEEWAGRADAVSAMVDGPFPTLLVDVVTHEHDLRAAIGEPGARGVAEVRVVVPLSLEDLAPTIAEAGLGALMVDSGPVRWTSHFARPGCTFHVDPWEAARVLECRRTAEEILALPATGDAEPYVAVLERRRPLPAASLGER